MLVGAYVLYHSVGSSASSARRTIKSCLPYTAFGVTSQVIGVTCLHTSGRANRFQRSAWLLG